jgi:hypothetical protein
MPVGEQNKTNELNIVRQLLVRGIPASHLLTRVLLSATNRGA